MQHTMITLHVLSGADGKLLSTTTPEVEGLLNFIYSPVHGRATAIIVRLPVITFDPDIKGDFNIMDSTSNHPSQEYLRSVSEAWLERFSEAVRRVDPGAVADCVQEDGWFRDLLTFTWDFRSIHRRENLESYLKDTLLKAQLTNVQLEANFSPRIGHFGPGRTAVDAALKFETSKALGKGFVRISLNDGHMDKPEALGLFMMITDWKGHEEVDYESGIYGGHTIAWQDIRAERRKEIEETPDVLIGASWL